MGSRGSKEGRDLKKDESLMLDPSPNIGQEDTCEELSCAKGPSYEEKEAKERVSNGEEVEQTVEEFVGSPIAQERSLADVAVSE